MLYYELTSRSEPPRLSTPRSYDYSVSEVPPLDTEFNDPSFFGALPGAVPGMNYGIVRSLAKLDTRTQNVYIYFNTISYKDDCPKDNLFFNPGLYVARGVKTRHPMTVARHLHFIRFLSTEIMDTAFRALGYNIKTHYEYQGFAPVLKGYFAYEINGKFFSNTEFMESNLIDKSALREKVTELMMTSVSRRYWR